MLTLMMLPLLSFALHDEGHPQAQPACTEEVRETQLALFDLRHSVEAARVLDMHERDAYRSNLAQAFAAGFMTLVAIIVGIERRLRRELKRGLIDQSDRVKAENERTENLNREARNIAAWLGSTGRLYSPKYECMDHGSCALPPGHGAGKTEVVHEDHVGHQWTTRHNVFDPEVD